jgi:hypothetical protein
MNRTGRVKPGVATGRAPNRLSARWFVSMVAVGLPLVVACATTIDGQPSQGALDDATGASGDADLDALGNVSTDDSTTTPAPDVGGGSVDDGGTTPMDVSVAPVTDGSQPNDGVSPMDSPPPPIDSPPPPMDSRPPPMDSPPPPVDSPPPPVDSGARCPGALALPYPVDGNGTTQPRFFPYGYDGDFCATQQAGTSGACPGHALAGAVGQCWSVTVTPRTTACTDGGVVKGWTGVRWQYPANNWSTVGGLNICAATKMTFWAKGALGGETISFYGGNTGTPYEAKLINQALTTTWTQYTVPFIAPGPDSNVTQAFFWLANEPALGSTLSFMIDDIQWQ